MAMAWNCEKRSLVAEDFVKSISILGVSVRAAVASMLFDPCHARMTECEQVTFNSSERISGAGMAGRTRPETTKKASPSRRIGKHDNWPSSSQWRKIACCVPK
jgi:hypothetical protein